VTRVRKTTQKELSRASTGGRTEGLADETEERDGKTLLDGPRLETNLAGEDSGELLLPSLDSDDTEEQTLDRGSRPPRPSSSRRLSPTLMKIFHRRRQQIGLSIEQLAKLSGVDRAELERFEGTEGRHRLLYDHAVVVARVLGLKPGELPGLRAKESRDGVRQHLSDLYAAMASGPTLTFEGKSGERYGGDLERVIVTPAFTVQVGDHSLADVFPKGTLLLFAPESQLAPGDVCLLRHARSSQLALRRLKPPSWMGIKDWQPALPVPGNEWRPVGRLQVALPRAPH
jgi:transcriptional regulator with XRE-family HTH domain